MHRSLPTILALSAFACGVASAMTGDSVAPQFRGTWVPAKATCDSPLKLVIDATVVTFVSATERAEYRKLDQCFSCMGRDVQGVTLLSTDAMGDSPWTITMDGTKKARPVVSVAVGKPERLGARFPLGNAALKRCP